MDNFLEYAATFNVDLGSTAEKDKRFAAFKTADDAVKLHNSSGSSFTMAHNEFSSRTDEEMRAMMGRRPEMAPSQLAQTKTCTKAKSTATQSNPIDWRDKNAVAKVRQQGNCGSCYSFGVIASMEGLFVSKGLKLRKLSEQVLVSCDKNQFGCNGGLEMTAFNGFYKENGPMRNKDYKYRSGAKGNVKKCEYDA